MISLVIFDLTNNSWSVDGVEVPQTTVGYSLNTLGDPNTAECIYLIGGATSDWWDNSGGPIVSDRVWKYALTVGNTTVDHKSQLELDLNPNPASDIVQLKYEVPKKGLVRLEIHDLNGKVIDVLVNEQRLAGAYSIDFNTTGLESGIYLCTVELNGSVITKKAVVER